MTTRSRIWTAVIAAMVAMGVAAVVWGFDRSLPEFVVVEFERFERDGFAPLPTGLRTPAGDVIDDLVVIECRTSVDASDPDPERVPERIVLMRTKVTWVEDALLRVRLIRAQEFTYAHVSNARPNSSSSEELYRRGLQRAR